MYTVDQDFLWQGVQMNRLQIDVKANILGRSQIHF